MIENITDTACAGGDIATDAADLALALGGAFAGALASIDGECTSTAGAAACAWGEATVSAAASAFASTVVTAMVDVSTCDCGIDIEASAMSFQEVFVQAAASVREEACITGAPPLLLPAASLPAVYTVWETRAHTPHTHCIRGV